MTGLVGWWPLHENSGRANDLSGHGNHGSLYGGVVQGVAGKGGLKAYSFDGSDDYVDIPNNFGIFDGSVDFTISCWVKPHDLGDGRQNRVVSFGGENFVNIWEQNDTDNNQLALRIHDGSNHYAKTDPLQNDEWVHIVAIFRTNDQFSIWRNGVREGLNGDGVNSITPTSGDSLIGARRDKDFFIDAEIADVRIYNRALSQSEVQELYEWGSGDYTDRSYHDGSDSGAVSRWRFDGDVKDSWSSNDGTDNTSAGYSSDAIRGKAKKFDGDDDYVDIGQDSSMTFSTSDSFSISSWIYPTDNGDTAGSYAHRMLSCRYSNSNAVEIISDVDGYTGFVVFGNSNASSTETNIPVAEWSHVVGVYDGQGNTEIFVNGVRKGQGSASLSGAAVENSWRVGQFPQYPNDPGYFSGKVDDLRFYSRELSPSEIFELYQWGTRGRDMRKLTVNKR